MHGIVERGRCVRIRSRDSSGLWPGCFHQREVSTEQSSIVVACRTTQLSWNLSIWQFPLIWIINNIYVRFWSWKSNYCKIRRCPNRLDSPFFRYGLKFAIVTHEEWEFHFSTIVQRLIQLWPIWIKSSSRRNIAKNRTKEGITILLGFQWIVDYFI